MVFALSQKYTQANQPFLLAYALKLYIDKVQGYLEADAHTMLNYEGRSIFDFHTNNKRIKIHVMFRL